MKERLILAIDSIIDNGCKNGLLGELDDIIARNSLFHIFKLDEKESKKTLRIEDMEALKTLYEYKNLGLTFENFVSRIMGEITPRNSEIINRFYIYLNQGKRQKAIDWYYKLCQDTKYIIMDRVTKNKKWKYSSNYGELEITINLSKPEKNPKDIIRSSKGQNEKYPKCVLCKENIGYKGRLDHPERSNHRIIPISLNDEKWYLQFSPYIYYDQHLIVFSDRHVPMNIDNKTVLRLLDFIDIFPQLFIGSNAELPIVGGSILNHNHYQGGNYIFPIDSAKIFERIDKANYQIEILDWPVSTVKIVSKNRDVVEDKAAKIIKNWKHYENQSLEILPFTNGERHNTTTLVARKIKNKYCLYISFRNNRCNEKYPYGIFHAREENHHIKKENIGLIEVMGLAILPGRLDVELKEIKDIILSKKDIPKSNIHKDWIEQLKDKYNEELNSDNINNILEEEIGRKFIEILEDCGVFKKANYDKLIDFVYSCID